MKFVKLGVCIAFLFAISANSVATSIFTPITVIPFMKDEMVAFSVCEDGLCQTDVKGYKYSIVRIFNNNTDDIAQVASNFGPSGPTVSLEKDGLYQITVRAELMKRGNCYFVILQSGEVVSSQALKKLEPFFPKSSKQNP